ncbi:hypothetical protein [Bifidobacterium longum]|uniref:hypothetical protein n=1 Tax=Bifidobacterium longum TaxID=216816 RepID=UPI001F5A8368|nr:hypothetical protein [Bifidobacterium longum]
MLDDRFSVLAKPTGAVCNLECEYCFFLSKDQVLDGADAMDEATMELHLRRYLDEQPDGEVTVAWQGGRAHNARPGVLRQGLRPGRTPCQAAATREPCAAD